MSGGTGAVSAKCGGALLASSAEHCSGAGTAFQPWPLQTEFLLAASFASGIGAAKCRSAGMPVRMR
jgi:hypothetical protein